MTEKFNTALFDGQISRRQVLWGLASAGLGAAVLSQFGGVAFAASEGGTLTANMKDPPNFDIIGNSTSWVILTLGPCYNGLITNNPEKPDELIGELADSWEVSADGKLVTFKLHDKVQFHDGMPFTSADVKHTFDLVRNPPEGTASIRQSSLSAIDRIETPDKLTVEFHLKRPQPSFLPLLATGWMVVMPKHILERDGNMQKEVIGTGPFKFKDYQRGVRLDLVRNDSYFQADRPRLDGITYFVAEDPSTLDAYFQTGQILFYNEMSSDSGLRFEKDTEHGLKVQRVVALNPTAITLNGRKAPLDDKRVRQAISYAIDRNEAIKLLEQGQAQIGGFIPPGRYALPQDKLLQMPGYGAEVEQNQEKARKLLAEAGHPNGLKLRMLVRKNINHEERAVMVQGQLARVGIEVALDVQESAMFFDNFNAANFDLVSQGGIAYPVNDPDVVFGSIHTSGPANISGVTNAELDKLFEEQALETDVAKRTAIAHRMEEIALDECSRIVLFYQNKFVGHSAKVSGYVATGNPDDSSRMANVALTA
ncbi:peptide/nickel transport system substrate-binding protein [Aminobacter niigataensis]|uniref:Peptide/nickel transport system substrate-binding protein n=1 Tax=Aminobacter niigataensis TaxID=83265 RepID=A0ABR6L1E8_9HYPH|nr:ABC transporter substrate-binding protein [Aminobacter niigataensis]MBB4650600.1 peptide/nickel transport system substrate-binding protein [Aminobacter niigataensis]